MAPVHNGLYILDKDVSVIEGGVGIGVAISDDGKTILFGEYIDGRVRKGAPLSSIKSLDKYIYEAILSAFEWTAEKRGISLVLTDGSPVTISRYDQDDKATFETRVGEAVIEVRVLLVRGIALLPGLRDPVTAIHAVTTAEVAEVAGVLRTRAA